MSTRTQTAVEVALAPFTLAAVISFGVLYGLCAVADYFFPMKPTKV